MNSEGDLSWADEATEQLCALLQARADPRTKQYWTGYLKGAAAFRGVPMGGVRAAVGTVVRDHHLLQRGDDELLDLAVRWTSHDYSEDKLAAVLLVAEHLPARLRTSDADQLARPFSQGHIHDWNVCDWYATKALHAYLNPRSSIDRPAHPPAVDPVRAQRLAEWTGAPELWQRRAALVAFVPTAKHAEQQFPGYTTLVLEACAANLVVPSRFAHTGPGWVLRELSRSQPEKVIGFLHEHPELSSEGRRMASARLRPGTYRRR